MQVIFRSTVLLSGFLFFSILWADQALIHSVQLQGTQRRIKTHTKAGAPLNPETISEDVKLLWQSGLFSDVRVVQSETPDGVDIVFHVAEKPRYFLRKIEVDSETKYNPPKVEPGTMIDEVKTRRIVAEVQGALREQGYMEPAVTAKLIPVGVRQADLLVTIDPGKHYKVEKVKFTGDVAIDEELLRKQLTATKVRRVLGFLWKSHPSYSDQAVQVDINRMRTYYAEQGYLDARVMLENIEYTDEKAVLTYNIEAGKRYRARSIEVRTPELSREVAPGAGNEFPTEALCKSILDLRRQSEQEGKIDFDVRLQAADVPAPRSEYEMILQPRGKNEPNPPALDDANDAPRAPVPDEPVPHDKVLKRRFLAVTEQEGGEPVQTASLDGQPAAADDAPAAIEPVPSGPAPSEQTAALDEIGTGADPAGAAADSETAAEPAMTAAWNSPDDDQKWVSLIANVETGPTYYVGRIEFRGHHSFSDSTIRRALMLDEGDLFDWGKLRHSIVRLNQLGMFAPITGESVQVVKDTKHNVANITIHFKQVQKGRWALSGPVGPMSVAGPLQGSIFSRLPAWGRGILEGSTYFLTFSMTGFSSPFLKFMPGNPAAGKMLFPMLALRRPYIPGQEWLSGFVLSPQLGIQGMAMNYGMTQVHRRVRNLILSDKPDVPEVVMPVERVATGRQNITPGNGGPGPGAVVCEPPRPSLFWLRTAGAFAVDWFLGGQLF